MGLKSGMVLRSYKRLFQLCDRYDIIVMLLGTLGSIISGFALPTMYMIQNHLYNNYAKLNQQQDGTSVSASNQQAVWCVYLATVTLIGAYLEVSCWIYTGHKQAGRLRVTYVSCVLRQDSSYFDCKCSSAEVINNVSTDIVHVQEAVGEKLGQLIENLFLFLGSFAASMLLTWRLTLIVLPFVLLLLLPGFMYSRALSRFAKLRHKSYASAGKIAEQAISSIRLVYSFVAEKRTWELYSEALEESSKVDRRQGLAKGLALGIHGLRYVVWAVMIWYGGTLVSKGLANGSQILLAGSGFVVGSMALGSLLQNLKEVSDGHGALCRIFHVLDTTPSIDIGSSEGKVLEIVKGQLEFRSVMFAYPSRPESTVLKEFNLVIQPGKTTAVVGRSGSGKSTVVSLIERLYDPLKGEVFLDGTNIKHLQLKWYRQQIGLVSQEPILFSSTIKDNILLGKNDATMDEVIAAAKKTDAHSFITSFSEGYNTQVGVRGTQLSGGQKQRIALARAIIRDPAILLLDEATSALDNRAEKAIQKAIQEVCVARTALVIAHKLKAIQSADLIAVVDSGRVVELGSHEELTTKETPGAFMEMFQLQQQTNVNEFQQREETDHETINTPTASKTGPVKQAGTVKGSQKLPFLRLLQMNRPEWRYCLLGLAGAVSIGFIHPLFVAIGADSVSSFYSTDQSRVRHRIRIDAAIFAALSLASLLVNIVQHYSFGVMGAALTRRVRERMLAKILHLDISWFDQERNSSGALASRLAASASMVRTVVGDRMSLLVQTVSTIAVSLVASFVFSWRLAIVITSIQPVIVVCFFYRVNNLQDFARKAAKIQEDVSQLVLEGVTQHQTVAAFSSQEKILAILRSQLGYLSGQAVSLSQTAGITSGVALFALFSSYGLCLWYGGRLIEEGKSSFKEFLLTFYLLISTGRSLADTLALSPDISQGTTVAESVLQILDESQTRTGDNQELPEDDIWGDIEFDEVSFAYPSRPETPVLNRFRMTVKGSQTVALAGRSGSGKSTIISLLERFYEPQAGCIRIAGRNIKEIPLEHLRHQIGLVSQEPTLFALTIRANIAYGRDNASDAEIVDAAKAANAHAFISALPQGYSTMAGEVGVQLSGGQKQRIAIARAVLKQPKILLLDEATSALDANSESLVQKALDRIMIGKTTIIVAHRLSTIKNADRIVVVNRGTVLEQGSHEELLAKGSEGAYFSLIHA